MCDVVEISSKSLNETIVRVLKVLSQETGLRSRRLKQQSQFHLKLTSILSRRNMLKRSHFRFFFPIGIQNQIYMQFWDIALKKVNGNTRCK